MISLSKLACYSASQLSYPITKLPHYILHAVLKLSLSPNYPHLTLPNRSHSFCIGFVCDSSPRLSSVRGIV